MLTDNLLMLRNIRGYSQEKIAELCHVSRQAYAKWESGESIPDIEKCQRLAKIYNVSLDSLVITKKEEGIGTIPPPPTDKNIFGTVVVNDRGQIVIPKDARDKFEINPGEKLVVLSDSHGIALVKASTFEKELNHILSCALSPSNP